MKNFNQKILIVAIGILVIYWIMNRRTIANPKPVEGQAVEKTHQVGNMSSLQASKKIRPQASTTAKEIIHDSKELLSNNNSRPSVISQSPPAQEQATERRFGLPDYSAGQFRIKFKNKNIVEWLKESQPFNPLRSGAAVPNDMAAYILKGEDGEKIRYRQAMGLNGGNDCVSVLLPGRQPIIGTSNDRTLQLRQTNVKWTYIIILKQRHYFLYHIDTTDSDKPVPTPHVLFYYERNEQGTIQFKGEMVGHDDEFQGAENDGAHESIDFCSNTY